MARICPLFSSSKGNSTFIRDDNGAAVLIDAGVSYKRLCDALLRAGGSIDEITAVAVTHEHGDHVGGLMTLLKKKKIPLYASCETISALNRKGLIPPDADTREITDSAAIRDMILKRFPTSHDCPGSSGYTVTLKGGDRISVCTDLGVVTGFVREGIKGSKCVIFESNHDVDMLKRGPYPPDLKLRILSEVGHLSNNACADQLAFLLKNGTTRFILGHLSQENNLPTLARITAQNALTLAGAKENEDYILSVAKPDFNEVTAI